MMRPALRSHKLRLKCDGTRAETRFRLSAKRMSPFKSAGESVQSTTCSRGVRISSSNAGYTMFRGSVKRTGYQLHSPVSHSLPLPCVTVCHHISTGLYQTQLPLYSIPHSSTSWWRNRADKLPYLWDGTCNTSTVSVYRRKIAWEITFCTVLPHIYMCW